MSSAEGIITGRFRPESDIDFLVECDPDNISSLSEVVRMERELPAIVGRKVDLRTAEDLSLHAREQVKASALVQYQSG